MIETRRHISDADLTAVRSAGYNDAQVVVIITLAVRTLMTIYIKNVNQTSVDIPLGRSFSGLTHSA